MAIAAQPTDIGEVQDQVIQLRVPWSVYETLVETLGDHSHVRLTYDGEYLEILSPGTLHDLLAQTMSDMLASVRLAWQVRLAGYRTATFRAKKKKGGFEGDLVYYVGGRTNVRLGDRLKVNLAVDPPPDLVVEIDITTRSAGKYPLFARLGILEVWHYTPERFAWYALESGVYVPIETSRMIAGLPLVAVSKRLATVTVDDDDLVLFGEWDHWLRDNRHLHEAARTQSRLP
jgi:Uma2 family endonuclease